MAGLSDKTKATLRDAAIIAAGLAGAFVVIYLLLRLLLDGWALGLLAGAIKEVEEMGSGLP